MNTNVLAKLMHHLTEKHGKMSVWLVDPDGKWHELQGVDHTIMRDSGEENPVLLLRAGEKKDG